MRNILLSDALRSYSFRCPHCEEPLFSYQNGEWSPHGQTYWLFDGTGLAADATHSHSHDLEELLVGNCPFCKGQYFVVELQLSTRPGPWTDSTVENFVEFLDDWRESPENTPFIATPSLRNGVTPERWLVEEVETPVGLVHFHTMGPFRVGSGLPATDPNSLLAFTETHEEEFARQLLREVWPAAVDLLQSRQSDLALSEAA